MSRFSVICIIAFAGFLQMSAQDIILKRLNPSVSESKSGVSWGVPFEKGKISKTQQFVLKSDKAEFPVQTWPLAFWPDGSVKWLGCASVPDTSRNFRLMAVKNTVNTSGIFLVENENEVVVKSGQYIYRISKRGQNFIDYIRVRGKIITQNGRLTCRLENRISDNQLQFENYTSVVKNVVVEQNEPIRTVIKISGMYYSEKDNREFLPFDVRLYFYRNVAEIRLVHSFVFDGHQESDFIKGLGVVFDVPFHESVQNRHVRFSAGNGGLWSEPVKPIVTRSPFIFKGQRNIAENQMVGKTIPEITNDDSTAFTWFSHLAQWNDYKLTQLNENGFSISKRTNQQSSWLFANAGKRSDGLALVGDVSGGLAVSLKNFWQSYPASLEVNNATSDVAQLKVWIWSPDAEAMDLRHYDTIPHDLDATYEDVQPGLSTPFGIARTSELTLIPFDNLPTKNQTVEWAKSASETPLLVCIPEYLYRVKAFGTWSLPDYSNETKSWMENQLDSSLLYYERAVDEHHWYGFWNYGDVMHTYDETRHVWRYDIGGYAWDNTELAPNNWLWYSFLRTGNPQIFRMAEAMTRHTGEVDAYHLGDMKGLGSRHNVSHWGCGSKEARIGQAAWKRFYYYLTTDERCGDLMRESLDAEMSIVKYDPLRIAQPRNKYPYNAPARLRWGPDWLALAGNWMTEWERTGNINYRNKILTGLQSLTKLPDNLFTGPNGLCYDPETGKIWYDGKPDVTNKNHLATIMGGFEMLTEMFDMIDYKPFRKTFTEYCRFYSMSENDSARNDNNRNWGDINFRTPRLTAFAARELNDDQLAARAWSEFFQRYRRFGTQSDIRPNLYGSKLISGSEVTNPIHENPRIGTNGTAQWGLNAIIMLELIGDKMPDAKTDSLKQKITQTENLPWKTVFRDNFSKDWKKNWFLDGEKAGITNSKSGLLFKAGNLPASDADHAVLWTKKQFTGDVKVEFDFVRRDSATKFVNILYLFAEGSGVEGYDKDIAKWTDKRKVPTMKTYFDHMNAYHISFAAFENDNLNPAEDYIRARRYMPETGNGLKGTDLLPDNFRTGMFKPGVKYHVTVIKKDADLLMKITGDNRTYVCGWKTNQFPDLNSGRIGLRLMGSRVSEISNFNVCSL